MYELIIVSLIAIAGIFVYMAANAINEIMRIIYTYGVLFATVALLFSAIAAADTYGIPSGVLSASLWIVFAAIIFETLLIVFDIFFPTLLLPVRGRLSKLSGGKDD